ncbi:MAG: PEP-CTERM sorting domain-containing protein [Anaerohalosphaera sp.]|nr:PEP-CTERM sorting domain-containing protein [Anaerohalosphaera sp.]
MRVSKMTFGKCAVMAFIALSAIHSTANAGVEYVINPSDDGTVTRSRVDNSHDLWSNFGEYGIVEFSLAVIPTDAEISKAMLSINPYALPLDDSGVMVFGYNSEDGKVTRSDYSTAATYVGTILFPDNVTWGQIGYIDITDFMLDVESPYVGFKLVTTSLDIFSSLEHNYGKPSQLTITLVPEPASILLLAAGAISLARFRQSHL